MRKSHHTCISQVILKLFLVILCIVCVLPTWLVIAASFTDEMTLSRLGFHLIPTHWSLEGYNYILSFGGQIVQSYKVTIFAVVVGTLLSLAVTSMAAFVLSREEFVLRPVIAFYFLLTMLINGGLLASYLTMTNIWNMRNNIWVLVLPGAFSVMNCFVMRSFIQGNVPNEVIESARIDGAGDFRTYIQIVLPLMTPALAAIGFMTAVGHWNDWSTGYLYINEARIMPLQLVLMRLENEIQFLQSNVSNLTPDQIELLNNTPVNSGRMAMLVTTIIPIMLIYPFFQKYFIKGITLGSMKG